MPSSTRRDVTFIRTEIVGCTWMDPRRPPVSPTALLTTTSMMVCVHRWCRDGSDGRRNVRARQRKRRPARIPPWNHHQRLPTLRSQRHVPRKQETKYQHGRRRHRSTKTQQEINKQHQAVQQINNVHTQVIRVSTLHVKLTNIPKQKRTAGLASTSKYI